MRPPHEVLASWWQSIRNWASGSEERSTRNSSERKRREAIRGIIKDVLEDEELDGTPDTETTPPPPTSENNNERPKPPDTKYETW